MQIIFDIAKIANTSNIANFPIVANIDKIANIAIITKVVKIAKNYQNCQNCQNHNIANIAKIVKIAKLDKIDKIHKCALNSTNVYQIPLLCTKILLSLISSSVIDWNTSIVKIAEITKIINHELGFITFVKGGILLGYMVGNKCGKVKDAITTDDCKSVLFYLIHTRIIWSPVYLFYVISKKWSK